MAELPQAAIDEAERLTQLARQATDPDEQAAYEDDRDDLLADHGYTARVREEDLTLVLHPEEWLADGVVRIGEIEDTDRAVEVSLGGPGDPDSWAAVEKHNADLVATVAEDHGRVHAANARAFADFMGNHYARHVESATAAEIEEFLLEYFPRNAWPSEKQKAVVEQSLELLFRAAGETQPERIRRRTNDGEPAPE